MLKTLDLRITPFRFPALRLLPGALFVLGAELASRRRARIAPYPGPAVGWGSAKAVAQSLMRVRVHLSRARLLLHQNTLVDSTSSRSFDLTP
jgi:hypothetical protein